MTTPTAMPTTAPARTPGPARIGLVIAAVLVPLVALLIVAFARPGAPEGGMRDTGSSGHAALARLLADEEIEVSDQTRWAGVSAEVDNRTTLVVTDQGYLSRAVLQAMVALRPAQIVLIDPGRAVDRLELGIETADPANLQAVEPDCTDPVAQRSGTIRLTSRSYTYTGGAGCYRIGEGQLMVQTETDGVPVTILPGVGDNASLAEAGNAALAMQVLGRHPRVIFYHSDWSDPQLPGKSTADPGQQSDRVTLLPPGWPHAVALAVVAVAVAGLWRGRRLGPVLTEELPSVVPAAETVEGHGRLYEQMRARDTAAAHLRRAAIARLSRLIGRTDDTEVLAQALAERTDQSYEQIRTALAGPAPATDEDLVTLKQTLDALEKEARRP